MLDEIAARPDRATVLARVEERVKRDGLDLPTEEVLDDIASGRR
jgi:hypothetical protein